MSTLTLLLIVILIVCHERIDGDLLVFMHIVFVLILKISVVIKCLSVGLRIIVSLDLTGID